MEAHAEESSARDFRERVLAADFEAQKNVAPFLENPVLRRIIKTFTNDERGDFAKWACNPRVLEMLRRAQKAMDEGKLNEADAERVMIESLAAHQKKTQTRDGESIVDDDVDDRGFGTAPSHVPPGRKVRVETNNLVSALNEHVQLRMQGNQLYESRAFPEALEKYRAALSIVDLIAGTNPGDQAEIDKNRAATLMNVAAAHMGMQAFGEAIRNLNEANRIVPNHPKLLMRRARALTRRGAFEEARADLTACEAQNVVSRNEMRAARAETDAAEREVRRFLFLFFFLFFSRAAVSPSSFLGVKQRRRKPETVFASRARDCSAVCCTDTDHSVVVARLSSRNLMCSTAKKKRRRCAPSARWRGERWKNDLRESRDERMDLFARQNAHFITVRCLLKYPHHRAALASSTMRLAASGPYCCSYANSSMAASGSSGGGASFSSASVGTPSGLRRVSRTLRGSSHEISSASTPKNALFMGTDASSASSSCS